MHVEFVPLLGLGRRLYDTPRGMARFRRHLQAMVDAEGTDLAIPPLVAMNPMAREHVPALIDEYLCLDVETLGAEAAADAASMLSHIDGAFKVGFVVLDDLRGGWTNRYATEHALRCPSNERRNARARRRGEWLTAALWSSEPASAAAAREAVQMAILRAAYRVEHGPARTIAEMLAQEGECMALAGCSVPTLDAAELDYIREIIRPHLDATDLPTAIACLYGDAAARSLGFKTFRLSERAGLALALHDAQTRLSAR